MADTVDSLLGIEGVEDTTTLTVDNSLRTITVPKGIRNIGVESDDDVHRLYFSMPRYFGEFDLSEFKIRINYTNAKHEEDMYEVKDAAVNDADNTIRFTWLVGRHAFEMRGDVTFNLCLIQLDSEMTVVREFNTTPTTLPVLEGLETGEAIVQEHPDLIEQWKSEIFGTNFGYEAAKKYGFEGTEEEWLDTLRGETGVHVGPIEPKQFPYFWFNTSKYGGDDTVFIDTKEQVLELDSAGMSDIEEVEDNSDYTLT